MTTTDPHKLSTGVGRIATVGVVVTSDIRMICILRSAVCKRCASTGLYDQRVGQKVGHEPRVASPYAIMKSVLRYIPTDN